MAADHAEGHIPGTHFNIDVLEDDYTETALKILPKDKHVALYCRSGNRSKNADAFLRRMGIKSLNLIQDSDIYRLHIQNESLYLY